jgi:hypothetical protein
LVADVAGCVFQLTVVSVHAAVMRRASRVRPVDAEAA